MQKSFSFNYDEYDSIEELCILDQILVNKAIEACDTAYAPYSGFHVGAAVRLDNDRVVCGSNQENIAYPSGMCAERTAIFSASVQYPDADIVALAVVGRSEDGELVEAAPCGACRQVLAECRMRSAAPIRVLMYLNGGGVRVVSDASALLPFGFEF